MIFEALAEIEGIPEGVRPTKSEAAKIRDAQTAIVVACPDVNPEEIRARAKRYPEVMAKGAKLTAHALASNWGKCAPKEEKPKAPTPEGPPGWLDWLAAELAKVAEDDPAHGLLVSALRLKAFHVLPQSWQKRSVEHWAKQEKAV